MVMGEYRFTFDIDHMVGREEIKLRVTYRATTGRAARLYGDYPHPEEDGEVEIISIKHDGKLFSVSEAEEDAILEMAIARSAEDIVDAIAEADEIAEAADWRAQSRRDQIMGGFYMTEEEKIKLARECASGHYKAKGYDLVARREAARAEWKPIETAPKSGDPILLYKPDERMVGEYIIVGYWGEWPGKGECWIACDGKPQGYFSEVSQSRQGYPTHWMPLPSPPQLVVGAAMIAKAGE